MMKKLTALLLLCAMLMSVVALPTALADNVLITPTISSMMEQAVDKPTEEYLDYMLSTDKARASMCALLLLDYLYSSYSTETGIIGLDKMSFTGTAYIGRFGTYTVDAYLPLTNGNYLNLFYAPVLNEITCYGESSAPASTSTITFNSVSAVSVQNEMFEIAEILVGE